MLGDVITVMQKGQELANAEVWKNRQGAAAAVGALLGSAWSLAHAFGWMPPVDQETVGAIGGAAAGLYCLFNYWATAATSKRVGLPPRPVPPDLSPPTS